MNQFFYCFLFSGSHTTCTIKNKEKLGHQSLSVSCLFFNWFNVFTSHIFYLTSFMFMLLLSTLSFTMPSRKWKKLSSSRFTLAAFYHEFATPASLIVCYFFFSATRELWYNVLALLICWFFMLILDFHVLFVIKRFLMMSCLKNSQADYF